MHSAMLTDALKLLEEERAALRDGQLATVASLVDQKTALMRDLSALKLSALDAKKLANSAAANAKLLEAALRGIRDAQARLSALRAVRSGLNVYDANGARQNVTSTGGGLEHKV